MTRVCYEVDAGGIAGIALDGGDRPENLLDAAAIAELAKAVDAALAEGTVRGIVISSATASFCEGLDPEWLMQLAGGAESAFDALWALQTVVRKIEAGGKPFVAALNGPAYGAGFDLALGCHYRIAADTSAGRLGWPESKAGLMPAAGGTQRLSRMAGPLAGLPLLLEGRLLWAKQALERGLIDAVVPAAELSARARRWIAEAPPAAAIKPWDRPGFTPPGPDPRTLQGSMAFAAANALERKRTYANYPAQDAMLSAIYDGLFVPIETALRVETRYLAKLLTHPTTRSMMRAQLVTLPDARRLSRRPQGFERSRVAKIGVLGAGLMGSGIAHVAAKAGIEVVLLDRDGALAEKGLQRLRDFEKRDVAAGRRTQLDADATLARLSPGSDFGALRDVPLVVEAVFENPSIKAEVIGKTESLLPPSAIFATNTSTIPITRLAANSIRPDRFVGLHFFSPVQRMELVEIIRGRATSDATLAAAMDFVQQLGKTPIVVNDHPEFYTSRVFAMYTNEGVWMLADGVVPALIENAGRATGMPVPPLALCDEVGIDLIDSINKTWQGELGDAYQVTPAVTFVAELVRAGRQGKKNRLGFYDYADGGDRRLWPGLREMASPLSEQPALEELRMRLLAIQSLEAARCLEEGVITSAADGDVGALLGWSFAPWTGGPLAYIDAMGVGAFVETARGLAARYGKRYMPNKLLEKMAAENRRFYEGRAFVAR